MYFKTYLGAVVIGIAALVAPNALAADEDTRIEVALPAAVADAFMAEMRTHMGNLDDIVAALADGDFAEAARVADMHMSRGHRKWQALADRGVPAADIAAMRKMQAKMRALRAKQGGGMGAGHSGGGFGRFMPEDFRAMGGVFHDAAATFAETAKNAANPPTAADYRAVTSALGDVTAACRACHDSFKVSGVGTR